MPFNHAIFMNELRRRRGKIPQDLYDDMMASIEAGLANAEANASASPALQPRPSPSGKSGEEPPWIAVARSLMGTKEIVGPKHNQVILGWIKSLGGWFKDDETPWCGTFVGFCMFKVGIERPVNWFRAKEWSSWGKPCQPSVGAVVVFAREGGGHVGFLVGQSADHYYVLGGNQSNAVNIMPIAKARAIATRWPTSLALPVPFLPTMSGGVISRNEA